METNSNDLPRCKWARGVVDIYREYHDSEWGIPVHNDAQLFEMLVLESFQAGLSWLIILKKRAAFRMAFADFDPIKVAAFDERKIQELMADEKIVRNRAKISATISNARIFLALQQEYGSFANYLWGFTDNEIIINIDDNYKTHSELSDRIAKDMKRRGAKFFGTVIVYSYLQAVGVVNDHETTCHRYSVSYATLPDTF